MSIVILIPALNPDKTLIPYLKELSETRATAIIVVNDGSNSDCDAIFAEVDRIPKITILKHAVNLRKGAALKTGLNHIYCNFPDSVGVVTADADGQHLVSDIEHIAGLLFENPKKLILGVRAFRQDVPFRSRIGNVMTRCLFRWLVGKKIMDTQTGLRGIPREFIPKLLKIETNGFEFELEMLLACRLENRSILEFPIHSIYIDRNQSSHFNPLLDSMRIYFVLFRFLLSSMSTALIDYLVFLLMIMSQQNLVKAQIFARLVALTFNYVVVRKMVFYSNQKHRYVLPKYLILVFVSGLLSYGLIQSLVSFLALSVFIAKLIAESILFLGNFAIQRDFIFKRRA